MKCTGIVRRIDDLGRIVIPKEIRRSVGLKEGDPMEIFLDDGGVMFKKYNVAKTFTELVNDLKNEVSEEFDLSCRSAVLSHVDAIKKLLEDEANSCDKS